MEKMKNMTVTITEMDNGFRLSVDEQGVYGSNHKQDLIAPNVGEAIGVALNIFGKAAASRKEPTKETKDEL